MAFTTAVLCFFQSWMKDLEAGLIGDYVNRRGFVTDFK